MARKRELTISEEMELRWDDGMLGDSNEKAYRDEFEIGWEDLCKEFERTGFHRLIFDPTRLVC